VQELVQLTVDVEGRLRSFLDASPEALLDLAAARTGPHDVSNHEDRVANHADRRSRHVDPVDRNLDDPEIEQLCERDHLDVEREALPLTEVEEELAGVGAEGLEAALRVRGDDLGEHARDAVEELALELTHRLEVLDA